MSKHKNRHHRRVQTVTQRADAIRSETSDAFVNYTARLGLGAGSLQDGSTYRSQFKTSNAGELDMAYRSNWVAGKVVNAYAEDMTREGVELTCDAMSPDEIDAMHSKAEDVELWANLCKGVQWGRLYGGAVVVMLIDGQDMSTPLRIETVGRDQFKGLFVLDRWSVDPDLTNLVQDFGPNLGKPKFYSVNAAAPALRGADIHYSRLIRIEGIPLPWRQAQTEMLWGESELERLWDRLIAFDSTTEGSAQLVYKAHLRIMKIKGLRNVLATGGKAAEGLTKHLQDVRHYQSIEGLTVLDGEDDMVVHSYTFAGLSDVLLQFAQQISGATGIPLVRLLGQSPAGLSGTGEGDLRTYYDGIKQKQDSMLRAGLNTIFHVLHRSMTGNALPDSFGFEFVPLWQMTEEQKANVLEKKVNAIVAAYQDGIITLATALKELRKLSKLTGTFSSITDEEIEEAEAEPPKPDMPKLPEPGALPGAAAPAPALSVVTNGNPQAQAV